MKNVNYEKKKKEKKKKLRLRNNVISLPTKSQKLSPCPPIP